MTGLAGLLSSVASLRWRLTILFAVVLLPPTIFSLYLAWDAFEQHKTRAKLSVRQFAVLASSYERDFLRDTQRFLSRLADLPAIRDRQGGCSEALAVELARLPAYRSITVTDSAGVVTCSTVEEMVANNVSANDWFRRTAFTEGFALSDYTISPSSPSATLIAAQPLGRDGDGVTGVIYTEIRPDWLSILVRGIGLPPAGVTFLLDKSARVITEPYYIFDRMEAGLPEPKILDQVASRALTDFTAVGRDGQERYYSSVPVPTGGVVVLFGLPSAVTLDWIERDFIGRLVSLAVIWLCGILAAAVGTRLWVTKWVAKLGRVAGRYSQGQLSARLDLTRAPVELRQLGDTLMEMAERIEAREADLHRSLEQKNVLLREIHHRVKNNLQTITSLLNIHARSEPSPGARRALSEVQLRVRTLALVHRHLYETDDVRAVDLRQFVGELCQILLESARDADSKVAIGLMVCEMSVDSERAVPIALLITEAVTNALKHAFPDRRAGRITVSLAPDDSENVRLSISDDGVGLVQGANGGSGLGMTLMAAFARQLGGELQILNQDGVTVRVTLDRARLRPNDCPASADRAPAPGDAARLAGLGSSGT